MMTRRSFFTTGSLALAAGCLNTHPYGGAIRSERDAEPFRLGFAGFTFWKFKIEQALEMMQRLDVHYLCIKDFHLPLKATDAEIFAFKAKLSAAGVVGHGCGPISVSTQMDADAMFTYARRIGVNTIVAVPCEKKVVDGEEKRFASRRLCEYLSEKLADPCNANFRVAIHNHGPESPDFFPTGRATYAMVKDLHPHLGLCLDVGHDFRFGYDPADSIRLCADRIFDIHVKDEPEQSAEAWCVPAGRGKMNWKSIINSLREINYTGVVNIEYEKDMDAPLAGIAETVGYLRGIMDS